MYIWLVLSRPLLKLTSKSMQSLYCFHADNNNLETYYKIINIWSRGRAETCENSEMKVPLSAPKPERT
jgi:hypothetical protein